MMERRRKLNLLLEYLEALSEFLFDPGTFGAPPAQASPSEGGVGALAFGGAAARRRRIHEPGAEPSEGNDRHPR